MQGPINQVVNAVAGVNSLLLERLADAARRPQSHFPLPDAIREDFIALTRQECRDRAQVGICLGDAQFSHADAWSPAAGSVPLKSTVHHRRPWLSAPDSQFLTHTLLLVAWDAIHYIPSLGGVMFGMSEAVAHRIRHLEFADLSSLAREQQVEVVPRWAHRADIWRTVLQGATSSDPAAVALRLLQACASDSSRIRLAAALSNVEIAESTHSIVLRGASVASGQQPGVERPRGRP